MTLTHVLAVFGAVVAILLAASRNFGSSATFYRRMATQPQYLIGYVTAPAALAEALARHLVEQRVVACVNILGPVKSVYTWKGAVETGEEQLLMLKTTAEQKEAVIAAVRAKHEYEVPEVIFTPIVGGHQPYLSWISESVGPATPAAGSTQQ